MPAPESAPGLSARLTDREKEILRLLAAGHTVKTMNNTQTAVGDKSGLWTTVIAAVVFAAYQ